MKIIISRSSNLQRQTDQSHIKDAFANHVKLLINYQNYCQLISQLICESLQRQSRRSDGIAVSKHL